MLQENVNLIVAYFHLATRDGIFCLHILKMPKTTMNFSLNQQMEVLTR